HDKGPPPSGLVPSVPKFRDPIVIVGKSTGVTRESTPERVSAYGARHERRLWHGHGSAASPGLGPPAAPTRRLGGPVHPGRAGDHAHPHPVRPTRHLDHVPAAVGRRG